MNASLKKKLDCESEMKIFICGGKMSKHWYDEWEITGVTFDTSDNLNKKFFKPVYIMPDGDIVACDGTHDFNYDPNKEIQIVPKESIATVYKGNIIKNLIMDCQSYTKYRPNETTGGIFVSWRRKEELPTGA